MDEEDANQYVANKLAEAQAQLKEAQKDKPVIGTNINEYKQAKEKWQSGVDKAQKAVDYWTAIGKEQQPMTGSFGAIYTQFKGKPKEAIAFLLKKKDGEAIAALHHKDIGDINLVWGKEGTGKSDGYGLAKLAKYHPEVLDNLQEILNEMVVTKKSENRVQLESETHQASVRLTWDNEKKNGLLTAFEKKNSVSDNTTDTVGTTDGGKRNDTATPQNTASNDKIKNNSVSDPKNGVKNKQNATEKPVAETPRAKEDGKGNAPKVSQRTRTVLNALLSKIGWRALYINNRYIQDHGIAKGVSDPSKINGWANSTEKTIYINTDGYAYQNEDAEKHLITLLGHEVTHAIKADNAWSAFVKLVKAEMGDEFDKRLSIAKRDYEGIDGYDTEEDFIEEVCADWAGEHIFGNANDIEDFVSKLGKYGIDTKTLLERVLEIIKEYVSALKEVFGEDDARVKSAEAAKKVWTEMYNRQERLWIIEVDKLRMEERKNRILKKGTSYDGPFGLIAPANIKTADDIVSNAKKIVLGLKEREGGDLDNFDGYVYGHGYDYNAARQVYNYVHTLRGGVIGDNIIKDLVNVVGWKTVDDLFSWAKKEYKNAKPGNKKNAVSPTIEEEKVGQNEATESVETSAEDVQPVGKSSFGNVYNQFKGKAKEAIDWLKSKKEGEATGALHHHTVGDISLVWGNEKTGLAKIVKKHPEVLDNLQDIIDSMEIVQESDNRIKLESDTHFAVLSKEYKGEPREKWLLTAYEKKEMSEPANSSMDVESNLEGKSDDTATRQDSDISTAKIANNSLPNQENVAKNTAKEVVEWLFNHKDGDMLGVFHRDEIGDIDLVWGKVTNSDKHKGYGLAHIWDKHKDEFGNEQELADAIEDIINNGEFVKEGEHENTSEFHKDGRKVVVKRVWGDGGKETDVNKNWVVTAYDTSEEKRSSGTTPHSSAAGAEESRSATSNGKIANNSLPKQENGVKNTAKLP